MKRSLVDDSVIPWLLPCHKPFNNCWEIFLHVLYLLISEFEDYLWRISLKNFIMGDLHDLTIHIFCNFFLTVPSCLQSWIQFIIATSHKHNQIKVPQREKIRTMEIHNQTSISNLIFVLFLKIIKDHIIIKNRNIEFRIHFFVKVLLTD